MGELHVPFCSEQLKTRQADCLDHRIIQVGKPPPRSSSSAINAMLFVAEARQSEWRLCSWGKAQVLIDFINQQVEGRNHTLLTHWSPK